MFRDSTIAIQSCDISRKLSVLGRCDAIVRTHGDRSRVIHAFESNGSASQRGCGTGWRNRLSHQLELVPFVRTENVSLGHEFASNRRRVAKGSCRVRFRCEIGIGADLRRGRAGAGRQQHDCSENSDSFHVRLPRSRGELNRPRVFLAELHFTGRTPPSASCAPAQAGFYA